MTNSTQSNGMLSNRLIDNVEFINWINILSFLVGIQNIELNVTANDLDRYSKMILEEIHGHLTTQDNHLLVQDRHLKEQDRRLDRLETLVYEIAMLHEGKERF